MKTKIFVVSYIQYEESDNNQYFDQHVFTNEQEAREFFNKECQAAHNEAENPFETDPEDEDYESNIFTIDETRDDANSYTVEREVGTENGFQARVSLIEWEIDVPFATDRRKYGMTLKEIRDEIAAFKDCSFTEATKKAETFRQNCCVPLTWVVSIRLSFGKYSRTENGEVVYYGENRDTLHIEYTDREGDRHQFSIIE